MKHSCVFVCLNPPCRCHMRMQASGRGCCCLSNQPTEVAVYSLLLSPGRRADESDQPLHTLTHPLTEQIYNGHMHMYYINSVVHTQKRQCCSDAYEMRGQTCARMLTHARAHTTTKQTTTTKTPTQSSSARICMHTNKFKFQPNDVLLKCRHLQQSVCVCFLVLLSFNPSVCIYVSSFSRSKTHSVYAFLTVLCLVYKHVFGSNTWGLVYTATVFTSFHTFWMMDHITQ